MIEHGIDKPFMITFLGRYRFQCGTKEDYVEFYHSPYHGNTQLGPIGTGKEKDSIGNDLENFIEDLKCSLTRKKKISKIRTAISCILFSMTIQMYQRLKWRSQTADISMSVQIVSG